MMHAREKTFSVPFGGGALAARGGACRESS
jgi:hypothetical protein